VGKVRYLQQKSIVPKVRSFRKDFESVLIGDDQGRNIVSTLLIKRTAFRHEKEVRLLVFDAEKKYKNEKLLPVNIDPFTLISEISFDPRMNSSIYEIYKSHLIEIGYKGVIKKSTLYDPPKI